MTSRLSNKEAHSLEQQSEQVRKLSYFVMNHFTAHDTYWRLKVLKTLIYQSRHFNMDIENAPIVRIARLMDIPEVTHIHHFFTRLGLMEDVTLHNNLRAAVRRILRGFPWKKEIRGIEVKKREYRVKGSLPEPQPKPLPTDAEMFIDICDRFVTLEASVVKKEDFKAFEIELDATKAQAQFLYRICETLIEVTTQSIPETTKYLLRRWYRRE